jgi:Tfp pilus assembly protein PilN
VKAVNLIPSEQRPGAAAGAGESQGGAYVVLGLLAGLAIVALLYGVARHQVSSRKHDVANLTAQAQATQARANQLAPYTSFKQMAAQRTKAVSQLVETRFDWAHALHELGRVLPADASLSTVQGTIGSGAGSGSSGSGSASPSAAGASTVSSATPPGSTPTFTLMGCTTSQSQVAQTLQRLRLIDGVANVELKSSTKSESSGSSSGGASSGAGGSGGCPEHDPAFTVQVTFAALPTPPITGSTAPSASGGQASTAAAVSSTGGGQ